MPSQIILVVELEEPSLKQWLVLGVLCIVYSVAKRERERERERENYIDASHLGVQQGRPCARVPIGLQLFYSRWE